MLNAKNNKYLLHADMTTFETYCDYSPIDANIDLLQTNYIHRYTYIYIYAVCIKNFDKSSIIKYMSLLKYNIRKKCKNCL